MGVGSGREAQEGGDTCIMADSCSCMAETHNVNKQLSPSKN